jgi:hypothetical protein
MENLVILKESELREILQPLFDEIHFLRDEFKAYREREEKLKTFSIHEAEKMIGFHYQTIRNMVTKGILKAVYPDSTSTRYRITSESIRNYLEQKSTKK